MLMLTCHLLFDHSQFSLIHEPNIPGSYAIVFFTASDFTSITSHIYNWVFLVWLRLFILSGVISPLTSSSILGTYQPGEFSRVHDEKRWAGGSTGWNQSPQMCRWHHRYGRNWRTKEPLDEGERREWKSCLKTQHSKKRISWHLVPLLHDK